MLAAGVQFPVPLDELESHLREDIEQQVRDGTNEARAFEIAVQHLGQAIPLKREFMKAKNPKLLFLGKIKSVLLRTADVPFPALDDFDQAALQTLQLAPDEARHFNHDFVGTEHLLLGLTRSGSKTISNVMEKLGVRSEALRLEIERFVSPGSLAVTAPRIPYTPRARQALQLAADEAGRLSQPHVRCEHILLGLLREGSGVAALVLKNLGVRLENARAEIVKETDAHPEAG